MASTTQVPPTDQARGVASTTQNEMRVGASTTQEPPFALSSVRSLLEGDEDNAKSGTMLLLFFAAWKLDAFRGA